MNKIENMVESYIALVLSIDNTTWDELNEFAQDALMGEAVTYVGEQLDMTDEEVWGYLE